MAKTKTPKLMDPDKLTSVSVKSETVDLPAEKQYTPPGRPKGAKNKTTLFKEAMQEGFENLLEREGKAVFMAVVDKAKDGDMSAAKMILDRVVPVTKAVDVNAGVQGKQGITINIEKLVADVGQMDGELIEDGEIVDD